VPESSQRPPAPLDAAPIAFERRHIGPSPAQIESMLTSLGLASLDDLVERCVPRSIRVAAPLALPEPLSESDQLALLAEMMGENVTQRSFIGMGYYDTLTPPVIQRNILENPGWYTQYTPYQAEIAQGRLEALMNYQTLVSDLTGLPFANASLLDEGTAAAEAVTMCHHIGRQRKSRFFVDSDIHPQTLAVLRTRAEPVGIEIVVGAAHELTFDDPELFGVLVSYPGSSGSVRDYRDLTTRAHAADVRVVVATDLLATCLLTPPGEFGADIAIGSSQRFGVPLGYGGPHAAFLSTTDAHKRLLPGRIVGLSVDSHGRPAYRLALQTREQHIRRDRATSNICTAQVLLAITASMYAVYHGPLGVRAIAERVHRLTATLARGLEQRGLRAAGDVYFDTLTLPLPPAQRAEVLERARRAGVNLRQDQPDRLGVSLDETTTLSNVRELLEVFLGGSFDADALAALHAADPAPYPAPFARQSRYLTHPVFNTHHSEHELLRYMKRLENRDLSLTTSMIPLGSCTMKLNATAEMLPLTWARLGRLHPFAPADQARGYARLFADLEAWLAEITGMDAVSLQPNAGAQGEYAGLLAIRGYHRSVGDERRQVCLIPTSAHGTNPATAVMAGMRVVAVACDSRGNVDIADLRAKATEHRAELGALMLTYPSTHGVFEEGVREVCDIVHENGGLVYLDGANMNAQVGLCRPGDYGADVCHLNLHKTFCIPHGGGGPGMGPIAVKQRLASFLPGHPHLGRSRAAVGPVSAAPYGSASILHISWAYIRMMGAAGLRRATQVAILNANYMAKRLAPHYPILFTGERGGVAHEFIIDLRPLKKKSGIEVDDIAKRLMDYGFHSPTMSFPVAGTLMIEPTESESKGELDRFCDSMIAIREEIRAIEEGRMDREDNPLRHAPHTAAAVSSDEWQHAYPRKLAAYPTPHQVEHKYWPPVGRIDNARGDRQLICCLRVDAYDSSADCS
jgi:glycine cleavage system P protein (glycine dehydrogenase)